jgi:hypothetical protein
VAYAVQRDEPEDTVDIGTPKRQYTIDPIWNPVPKARPAPEPERPKRPAPPLEPVRRP